MRGPIDSDQLQSRELLREQIVMMLPAHHPLARRKRVPVELLNDLPCITMERSLSPGLYDAIASLYRQARIRSVDCRRMENRKHIASRPRLRRSRAQVLRRFERRDTSYEKSDKVLAAVPGAC